MLDLVRDRDVRALPLKCDSKWIAVDRRGERKNRRETSGEAFQGVGRGAVGFDKPSEAAHGAGRHARPGPGVHVLRIAHGRQKKRRMSRKLFVGGLSWNTTDEGLREAFARFGQVVEAKVVSDRETGRSRGFGFVSYQDAAEGAAAQQAMDLSLIHISEPTRPY